MAAPSNALVEVQRWVIGTDAKNPQVYLADLHTINRGQQDAIEMRNDGMILVAPPNSSDAVLSPHYAMIKSKIVKSDVPAFKGGVHPGQQNIWYSVYSDKLSEKQISGIKAGTLVPYALGVMQYKDKLLPDNKFIYTESCAWLSKNDVIVLCQRGENISYISD